jgi:hypothetical protein
MASSSLPTSVDIRCHERLCFSRVGEGTTRNRVVAILVSAMAVTLLLHGPISHAQQQSPDPNLPTVRSEALQELSNTRVRQHIMQERMEHYPRRCVCPYQTKDLAGRSCNGRHEMVKTSPLPICYPRQVSAEMIREWRRHH